MFRYWHTFITGAVRPLPVAALLAAALLGMLASGAPRLHANALSLGEENSWIRIQNVGGRAAQVDISFYDLTGAEVATDGCPQDGGCDAIPAGFGRSFFQQGFESLTAGYRGSAHVTVDQPFVAVLARDVFKDGAFQISGDSLRNVTGTSTQYAPIVQNNAAYVSRISVENGSEDREACFEIVFYAEGSPAPAATDPPAPTTGCPQGGQLVAPRGTMLRDEVSLIVPFGFDGAAVVRSLPTASGVAAEGQQPLVIVDTRDREAPGLATYRAVDGTELSRTVVLPLVDRNASDGQSSRTTRFRIVSATPGAPNEVTLLFEGEDAAGDRIEIEHTVVVTGALTCDQRSDGPAGCLPDGQALPATFRGTVRMQSVDPIAVVAQRLSTDGSLADYRGFTVEEAARQVVLPVLNKNFGPWGDSKGWNSWFRVLTFDGSTAHVQVIYFSRHFPGGLFTPPAAVETQRTYRQWEDRRLPDGWVGSAIVVADRPIVVVANLESDVFQGDPVMLYNGLGFD